MRSARAQCNCPLLLNSMGMETPVLATALSQKQQGAAGCVLLHKPVLRAEALQAVTLAH
jgi:hypothetical protein